MTKQVPLRLDDQMLEEVEKLKQHYGITTTNKVIIKMIESHKNISDKLDNANRKLNELNIKVNKMKHHYAAIKEHENELKEMME